MSSLWLFVLICKHQNSNWYNLCLKHSEIKTEIVNMASTLTWPISVMASRSTDHLKLCESPIHGRSYFFLGNCQDLQQRAPEA